MGSAKIQNFLLDRTATNSGGAATNSNNSPKTGLYSFFDVWHYEDGIMRVVGALIRMPID
jgi:hypothetical protein